MHCIVWCGMFVLNRTCCDLSSNIFSKRKQIHGIRIGSSGCRFKHTENIQIWEKMKLCRKLRGFSFVKFFHAWMICSIEFPSERHGTSDTHMHTRATYTRTHRHSFVISHAYFLFICWLKLSCGTLEPTCALPTQQKMNRATLSNTNSKIARTHLRYYGNITHAILSPKNTWSPPHTCTHTHALAIYRELKFQF